MMKCSKAKKLIASYVDGGLNGDQKDRLRLHIDNCRECSIEEKSQIKLAMLLGAWQPTDPTKTFQDLLAQLPEKSLREKRRGFLPIPQWAAACLVIVTIGLGFGAGAVVHPESTVEMPSQQQVASAMDLTGYDDAVETGLLMGASANPVKGGQR